MKVLVAEDDPVSAIALKTMLENRGHVVTMTADGSAAWKALQAEHFPVAILDWMMPYIDGLTVCRNVRNSPMTPYTCIIMLTAKQERENRQEALKAGVDVFLTKPLVASDLLARLQVAERILALERSDREA